GREWMRARAIVEVERPQHLAQRERALRETDRLGRGALEEIVVAGADAREHVGMQQQLDQRPGECGVEVRLRTEMDQHDVARDALLARQTRRVAPARDDLVEEYAS